MFYIAVVIPLLLLGLTLVMERVEQPLRDEAVSDEIAKWLEQAGPEEIEKYVSQGLSRSINRYWRSQDGRSRLRPLRAVRH